MRLWPDTNAYSPKRLFCLDLLRGLDMFYLAVLAPFVNWRLLQLHLHPDWAPEWLYRVFMHNDSAFAPTATGISLFDFGQPLFLFICGAAAPIALTRRLGPNGEATPVFFKHVCARVLMLTFFAALNRGLLTLDWRQCMPQCDTMLVIAAGYLGAALLMLVRNVRVRVAIPFLLLAVYWAIQQFGGDYTMLGNINYRVDGVVFGGLGADRHGYLASRTYPFALTTLGFAVVAMFGALSTQILKADWSVAGKVKTLSAFGVVLILMGLAVTPWIPPVRQIYTLSFCLITGGLSVLCLLALYVLTDICKKRRGFGLFLVFGSFSLFIWETANFFYPAVEVMAKHFAEGLPHLLGTDAFTSVAIGVFEMLLVTAAAICRYRMSLGKE